MARAKKRADGRYQIGFRYCGKIYNVCGKTVAEVQKKAQEKRAELEAGVAARENPTMDDYYKHFTESRRGKVRESSIRSQGIEYRYCSNVIVYNNIKFGSMHIADIKPADILKVQDTLQNSSLTPRTVNDSMMHLKHVFNVAMREDIIEKSPCRVLVPIKDEREPARENIHRALTLEETKKFFEEAERKHSYYLPLFKFLILTGVRIGEAGALTPSDIAADGIHIHATVTRNEDGAYTVNETTKTNAGKRTIPTNSSIIATVTEQKEALFALHGSCRKYPQLFTAPEGGIIREYTVNREIKRICKAAEIETFTCHAVTRRFNISDYRRFAAKTFIQIQYHRERSVLLLTARFFRCHTC